jgi:hypothetical protein
MKAMVVHSHRIASGLRRGLDAPPEIINHFLIANALMGTRAASGLAIPFCGGQKVDSPARVAHGSPSTLWE